MNYKACLFFLSVCFVAHAQSISNSSSNDVQVKTEEENKYAMVEYEEVLNDDIVWSRVVYEEIDLSEKFNHPLYFPKDGLKDNNRKSLWSIIRESILEKKIATLYNDANPNFNEEMEPGELWNQWSQCKFDCLASCHPIGNGVNPSACSQSIQRLISRV